MPRAMQVIPFRPEHLEGFDVQPAQAETFALQRDAHSAGFGQAWTVMHGTSIACGGIIEVWPGRGYVWALLSRRAGPHMLALTRIARLAIKACKLPRLEMVCDARHAAACRWAAMLGFQRETYKPLRAYLPGGAPAHLFARILE